jgi:hypothetical protein
MYANPAVGYSGEKKQSRCHSERSEESLLDLCAGTIKAREILRSAPNDNFKLIA